MPHTDRDATYAFLTTPTPSASLGDSGDFKPPLREAYAVYQGLIAPQHRQQISFVGTLGDFAEVLRQVGKSSLYSDEEWIGFFQVVLQTDEESARDVWDGLLCQPEY